MRELEQKYMEKKKAEMVEKMHADDEKKYLDPQTQMILFAAGVRGAVSYALVQNIPVFDSVTKVGSHCKCSCSFP